MVTAGDLATQLSRALSVGRLAHPAHSSLRTSYVQHDPRAPPPWFRCVTQGWSGPPPPASFPPVDPHPLESDPRFHAGLSLTLAREWYEAHEVLEELWREHPEGADRECLQGIIQQLVALTHLQRGNALGAFKVWNRARGKLSGVGAWAGIELGAWCEALTGFYTGEANLSQRVTGQLEGGLPAEGTAHQEQLPLPPAQTWPVPALTPGLAARLAASGT
jgi:uncharacterized protein